MKSLLIHVIFLSIVVTSYHGSAQSISRQLISSCSHSQNSGSSQLRGSIGESFISCLHTGNTRLTEGFLQPETERIFIIGNATICRDDSVHLNVVGPTETYRWYSDQNTSVTLDTNSGFSFMPENELWIYVTDEEYTDSVFISFKDPSDCPYELIVYEFITPNADGFNDLFYIENIHYSISNTIHIYDQWGHLVHSAENYLNTWMPSSTIDGVYVYIVEDRTGDQTYRGKLLIKKAKLK